MARVPRAASEGLATRPSHLSPGVTVGVIGWNGWDGLGWNSSWKNEVAAAKRFRSLTAIRVATGCPSAASLAHRRLQVEFR